MTDAKKYTGAPSPEWYTPAPLRALAVRVLGPIYLDPATCPENPMGAEHFCTVADGPPDLERWADLISRSGRLCPGVWLNPPYGREIKAWLDRLHIMHAGRHFASLALIPARPGARWYRELTGPWGVDLVCELDGRVTYDTRDAQGRIVRGSSPAAWASALVYQQGPSAHPLHLKHVRRQLATVGQVRLAGRARRQALRATRPPVVDYRQAEFWPANVVPIATLKGRRLR